MAGYFRRLDGHVYMGEFKADEGLHNGTFARVFEGLGLVSPFEQGATADSGTEFKIMEKTTLWGMPALAIRCYKTSGTTVFIENENEDYGDKGDYDPTTDDLIPVGHYVKARCPAVNDEIVITVDEVTYSNASAGLIAYISDDGSVFIDT